MAIAVAAKPDICVMRTTSASPDVLREVFLGMEEEGIPWHVSTHDSGDANELARLASVESRLEVGVGVDDKNVALRFTKLTTDAPLFQAPAQPGSEQVRTIGTNAARLIKRLPFKM